jgi:hypothetical protein
MKEWSIGVLKNQENRATRPFWILRHYWRGMTDYDTPSFAGMTIASAPPAIPAQAGIQKAGRLMGLKSRE